MPENVVVEVPDIGDFTDVPVIEVHVAVGSEVALDEPLLTLESDKATMDVPAEVAGTVTRVVSESFGALDDREPDVAMEIRASWTPAGPAVGVHLEAWVDMLGTVGGLSPLPSGVVALPGRRR